LQSILKKTEVFYYATKNLVSGKKYIAISESDSLKTDTVNYKTDTLNLYKNLAYKFKNDTLLVGYSKDTLLYVLQDNKIIEQKQFLDFKYIYIFDVLLFWGSISVFAGLFVFLWGKLKVKNIV
jgi:hypothetical protein